MGNSGGEWVQSAVAARPFLKWAGGKGQLISQYQPYFPTHFKTYCEPFLGGGAIFFHLASQSASPENSACVSSRLIDINAELVNVYCCVRDYPEALIQCLTHHQANHCKAYYYQIRANSYSTPLERAARLIYLNKTCFNGLYRENSKGQFNVPIGRYKNPKICDANLLRVAACVLKSVEILQAGFDIVEQYARGADDFVYFDPPYHPISATSSFTGYNRYSFKVADQERLQQTFATLANRGVQVMLSNSDCEFIRQLYHGFHMHEMQASRSINAKAKRRGKIAELLITSYPVNHTRILEASNSQPVSCQSVPATAIAAT
ncbi:MAG: DNA adenine methylase [Cyanobacteria bacterium P01_A01_bin.123]